MDISALGEFALIARLTTGLSTRVPQDVGVGDDCAVLDLNTDRLLLATCDCQVEQVHFTRQTSSPEAIGRKALAINLSDIAAMGGTPLYALISLILPAHLPVETLDGIYSGLREMAQRYDTALVGGNVSGAGKQSEQLMIDITLLGSVERGHALLRSGAHAGDLLCVTGTPGDSGAGFFSLTHPELTADAATLSYLHERHTSPTPRIFEGQVLGRFAPEQVTAALDISDGLSGDLAHLCERSHVGAQIELARLPLSPQLRTLANVAQRDPFAWALHSGEDYELLCVVAPEHVETVAQAVFEQTGTPLTVIGRLLPPEEGLHLVYPDGRVEPLAIQSWDHLQH